MKRIIILCLGLLIASGAAAQVRRPNYDQLILSGKVIRPASGLVSTKVSQWLNGTISGNEFVDISGNGYNADIVYNDITGSGFPYKSSAYIQQKAANYGKIYDPNNFWYTSNGTPNMVPVVALFQNIDYANIIFCRHIQQILNSDSVEIQEARVMDIVTYKAALTGSDLVIANQYFSVPAEVTGNVKWVASTGSDGAAGSKASPWATLSYASMNCTAGDLIYVKSGTYKENYAAYHCFLLEDVKNSTIQGLGNVVVQSNSATIAGVIYIRGTNTVTIKNILFDGEMKAQVVMSPASAKNKTFQRCFFTKVTGELVYTDATSTGLTFNQCVFDTKRAATIDILVKGEINILNSYIKSDTCTNVIYNLTANGPLVFKWNKVVARSVLNQYPFYIRSNVVNHIKFNNITLTGSPRFLLVTAEELTTPGSLIFKYNTISIDSTKDQAIQVGSTSSSLNWTVDLSYNTITVTSSNQHTGIIVAYSQVSPTISGNNIDIANTTKQVRAISVENYIVGRDCGTATIHDNQIKIRKGYNSYGIYVGSETTSTKNNTMVADVQNNWIYEPAYYTDTLTGMMGHSIFVGYMKNSVIKYNHVFGGGFGVVYKGPGDSCSTGGVFYNVLVGNSTGILIKGFRGVNMYGNTIYVSRNDTRSTVSGIYVYYNDANGDGTLESPSRSTNCSLRNNIIYSVAGASVSPMLIYVSTNCVQGFTSDYNLLYCTNPIYGRVAGVAKNTFSDWQAAGYDSHSVNSVPSFASISGLQFWPASKITGGSNLGASYIDGIGITSSPGYSAATKAQSGSWQIGAYIQ